MTVNVALGHVMPHAGAKGGDRGKGSPADGARFDEALAGKTDRHGQDGPRKHASIGKDIRDDRELPPPPWRHGHYTSRLGPGTGHSLPGGAMPADADEMLTMPEVEIVQDADAASDIPAPLPVDDMPDEPDAEQDPVRSDGAAGDDVDPQPAETTADAALAMLRALTGGDGPAAASTEVAVEADGDVVDRQRDGRRGAARDAAVTRGPAGSATSATADERAAARTAAAERTARSAPDAPAARAASQQASQPTAHATDPQPDADALRRADAPRLLDVFNDIGDKARSTRLAPVATGTLSGMVNVLGYSAALAPAPVATAGQMPLGPTAASLVAAIEGDATWRGAAAEAALSGARGGPSFNAGVNTLRIQLNPAELGMVTARLTASGSQLSIEIQVETSDARQRLSSDSDAILKALRAIGYDVEKVTIQQSSQSGQPNAQTNGGGTGRDQFQAREDGQPRGEGGRGTGGRNGEGSGNGQSEAAAERAGGGVYI